MQEWELKVMCCEKNMRKEKNQLCTVQPVLSLWESRQLKSRLIKYTLMVWQKNIVPRKKLADLSYSSFQMSFSNETFSFTRAVSLCRNILLWLWGNQYCNCICFVPKIQITYQYIWMVKQSWSNLVGTAAILFLYHLPLGLITIMIKT